MATISIRRMTRVRPAEPTPRHRLWISNLDLVAMRAHTSFIHFYRTNGSAEFFDGVRLREALGQVLIPFYPMAGRLARDEKGRIEIDCDGQGVLFVEADSDGIMNEFWDFTPTIKMKQLIPEVTYFKCGSISLGFAMKHLLGDGFTIFHFVNSWSDVARGTAGSSLVPFVDRTLLRARNPPTPRFRHVEYEPSPSMDNSSGHAVSPPMNSKTLCVNMFKLTREQINLLKENSTSDVAYSTYVLLAAHVWRCVCTAMQLPANQMTKLYVVTNGRRRLRPQLPQSYFGNVLFAASPITTVGELMTTNNGCSQAAKKIHEALSRMDDEYLRSALDFLEVQPNLDALAVGPHQYRCPNLRFTSWMGLPVYDSDFGWGRPVFTVPGWMPHECLGFVLPSPTGDVSVYISISLQPEHMMRFQNLIYQISPFGNKSKHPSKL